MQVGTTPEVILSSKTRYDAKFGRVKQLEYPTSALDVAQVSLYQYYNDIGALVREGFAADYLPGTPEVSDAIRVLTTVEGRGLTTGEQFGVYSGIPDWYSTQVYDSSGWLLAQCVSGSGNGVCSANKPTQTTNQPLDQRYRFDVYGNLVTQWHNGSWHNGTTPINNSVQGKQSYTYDPLMRMIQSKRHSALGAVTTVDYAYNEIGGLRYKTDYSIAAADAYTYISGSHKVNMVALSGGGSASYTHDLNGNVTQRTEPSGITQLVYDIDNLPRKITRGAVSSEFYDAQGGRYLQRLLSGTTVRDTWMLEKTYEREVVGTSITLERYYLSGGTLLTIRPGANGRKLSYLHTDRLGSPVTITEKQLAPGGKLGNAPPTLVEHRGFDAFGKAFDGQWGTTNAGMLTLVGSELYNSGKRNQRGFTGHEHLDEFALIHMNGRAYDYNLGRFLGVDPIIQFPSNSQSLNPYSYLMNNPLSGTDPTGYEMCTGTRANVGPECDTSASVKHNGPIPGTGGSGGGKAGGPTANGSRSSFSAALGTALRKVDVSKIESPDQRNAINESKARLDLGMSDANVAWPLIATGALRFDNWIMLPEDRILMEMQRVADFHHSMGSSPDYSAFATHFSNTSVALMSSLPPVAYASGVSRIYGRQEGWGWGVLEAGLAITPLAIEAGAARFAGGGAGRLGRGAAFGCCCFPAGTPVLTKDGNIAIEQIEVGDLVWARDPATGDTELKEVVRLYLSPGRPLYALSIKHEDGRNELIEVTDNHPFWVEGQGWVDTVDLKVGMQLQDVLKDRWNIDALTERGYASDTFNLEVEGFNTYFAGEGSILVHNCTKCGRTEPTLPPKVITEAGDVRVQHYTRSGDHGPAHLHVLGAGPEVRIGQNGRPLPNQPNLSPAQQTLIDSNRAKIRGAVNKMQRWFDYWRNH